MTGMQELGWDKNGVETSIRQAIHDECRRTKIAAKFLPPHPVEPNRDTVPSDTVVPAKADPSMLTVNPTDTTPIVELAVKFTFTDEQVRDEMQRKTAITLATRAANLLCQAEDILIFQGETGLKEHPLFTQKKAYLLPGNDNPQTGLLNAA